MFNDQSPSVWKDRYRDIATSQALADEIVPAVDVDAACVVHPADEGDPTTRQGQREPAVGIQIASQRKAGGQGAEVGPVLRQPVPWIPGALLRCAQRPMRLPEVIEAPEGMIHPPQRRKVRTGMTQDAVLPERVEALHMGVAPGLARRLSPSLGFMHYSYQSSPSIYHGRAGTPPCSLAFS